MCGALLTNVGGGGGGGNVVLFVKPHLELISLAFALDGPERELRLTYSHAGQPPPPPSDRTHLAVHPSPLHSDTFLGLFNRIG